MSAPVRLGARLQPGAGAPGIGAIAPFDFQADRDCWSYLAGNDDVGLHLTRTPPAPGPVSLRLAREVGDHGAILAAAATLLPVTGHLAYLCASGSFAAGRERELALREAVLAAGAASFVTTSEAMLLALRALGLARVSLLTPYDLELTEVLVAYLAEEGVEVAAAAYVGLDAGIHRLGAAELERLVLDADADDADAVLVSCTNLSTYELIGGLERRLGKPVLTANQVTIWAALGALGRLPRQQPGQRLFAVRP
jgi:maleate isomerase